ncbi:MAG: hypothetical protein IPP35_01260 [Elusimicrobia bacterium]|nr:hypothetical protein [Elusimicrobiota bacterium]
MGPEPKPSRRIFRALGWIGLGLGVAMAVVSVVAWRRLDEHLNSPGFKVGLETSLSKKREGRFVLGSLQSRLGFRPWVRVTGVSFKADNGDFRWSAESARIQVKLLPLLRRKVVFSNGDIEEPRFWIRRRPDGSLPVIAVRNGPARDGGLEYRIDDVRVVGAELQLVDESLPGHPSLTLQADASLAREGNSISLNLAGKIDGPRGRGRYRVDGRFGTENDVRVEASGFPLGLLGEFFRPVAPWTGALSLEAHLAGRKDDWRWTAKGGATRLKRQGSEDLLPFTMAWELSSFSTSTVRVVWASTGTRAQGEVTVPDISRPNMDLRLSGDRLDVAEILEVIGKVPPISGKTSGPARPVNLTARADLGSLTWGNWSVADVTGAADWAEGTARLRRFQCEIFQGTVTAHGLARRPRRVNDPWTVSGTVGLSGLQAREWGRAAGSSGTWAGALNGTAEVTELPIYKDGTLWGLAQARDMAVSVSAVNLGWESWRLDSSTFSWRRAGAQWEAGWVGRNGSSSFTLTGFLPVAGQRGPKTPSPATLRVDLDDLDLEVLGRWVPSLGFRRGHATFSGDWQSDFRQKPFRDFLFDDSSLWGFDLRLSSADWKGVPMDSISGRLAYEPEHGLKVSDLQGDLSGGSVAADGTVVGLKGKGPLTFSLHTRLKDLQTEELVAALSTNAYLVNGRFSGDLSVGGPLRPWDPSRLNGRVSVSGRDGSFRAAPAVLEVFSALKIRSLIQRLGGRQTEGLPFDVIEASATIRNGRYLIERPVIFNNNAFQLAYTGWVDVRFANGRGTLLFNFLQGTTDLIAAIPGLTSLVLGPEGDFLPLVVDVQVNQGKAEVNARSIQTLTGPLVNVVKNVFRLPFRLFNPGKQDKSLNENKKSSMEPR